MRVTNERAQSAIKAHHITGNLTNIVKDYATDLLEARELIKEMREEINLALRDFEKIDEVCKIANVMPFSLTKRKLFELLEKTKEYAE